MIQFRKALILFLSVFVFFPTIVAQEPTLFEFTTQSDNEASEWTIAPLSVVTMMREPGFTNEIVTQALLGTPLKVLEKKGGWKKVQTPDQYTGWTETSLRYISFDDVKAYSKKEKVILTDYSAFVYTKASDKSEIIMELVMGNLLVLTGKKKGRYLQVEMPYGQIAYVRAKAVTKLSDWEKSIRLDGDHIVKFGKKFLGVPYMWGGTSGRGLDCSGFTKTVYYMHGVVLPRDASMQFFSGEYIDISKGYDNLQKGDLLFFGKLNEEDYRLCHVTHVGIYMGNGEFIHAANRVKVNSFYPDSPVYDAYNTKRFLGARRIIGSESVNHWSFFTHSWYNF